VSPRSRRSSAPHRETEVRPAVAPAISSEAALSFLKDTKGTLTWSPRDLADTLKISRREAEQVIGLLEAQGYVKRAHGANEWMTTPAGESLAGAKAPRFTRESVDHALDLLKERIKQANKDSNAPFRITDAVAFGDFLLRDRARVQAADVGIGLLRRGQTPNERPSASEAKAQRAFLRQLRGKTSVLNIRPYADWMSKRTHLDLL
jgi:DNA-binding transcriptional MocR family regulator